MSDPLQPDKNGEVEPARSKSTQKRLFAGVGLFVAVIVAGVIVISLNGRDNSGQPTRGKNNPSAATPGARGDVAGSDQIPRPKDQGTDRSGKETKETVGVRPTLYSKYLDQLCPRLTEAEEDKLIAESGGDPNVLLSLVFAGSPRSDQWLREALRKAPENPLVHYAVLCNGYKGFDRLHSALELARLAPQDASPLYAAAVESLHQGDRERAISYLREAAGRDQYSTFYVPARDAAVEAYRMAGRPENDALARILLGGISRFEDVALFNLGEKLGLMKGPFPHVIGQEELGALVVDAHQKAIYSPGLDLHAYRGARGVEREYLRSFLSSVSNASESSSVEQHFSAPVSEMYNRADAEYNEAIDILWFSADEPGIYQRLNAVEKNELLRRILTEGELAAYRWAFGVRPDIFRSPDFVPQGLPRDGWITLITNRFGSP